MNQEIIKEVVKSIDEILVNPDYYNGKNLLKYAMRENYSMVLLSTTTRSVGKTSYFNLYSYFLNRDFNKNAMYIVRNVAELASYHLVFEDILQFYFGFDAPELKTKILVKDALAAIIDDDRIFAYVACLKKADALKKYSSIFRDTEIIILEEYQTLRKHDLIKNEPELLKTFIRTVGRGNGKQVRDILTVLLGNTYTLLNPYLIYFGLSKLYTGKDGFVTNGKVTGEFSLHNAASEKAKESAVVDIFDSGDNDIGASFLYSSDAFIKKVPGKSKYVMTIIYGKELIGVRSGIVDTGYYCVSGIDPNCTNVMALTAQDMRENRRMLSRYTFSWKLLRTSFEEGKLYFQNLKIKELMFDIIGMDAYN